MAVSFSVVLSNDICSEEHICAVRGVVLRYELIRGVALRCAVMALSHPTHRTHFISLSSFKDALLTDYKSDYTLHLIYFSPLKEKPLKSGDTEPCQGILTSISQLQMKGAQLGSHLQQCPSALLWILLIVARARGNFLSHHHFPEFSDGSPAVMSLGSSLWVAGPLDELHAAICRGWIFGTLLWGLLCQLRRKKKEAKRGRSWRVTPLAPACFSVDRFTAVCRDPLPVVMCWMQVPEELLADWLCVSRKHHKGDGHNPGLEEEE